MSSESLHQAQAACPVCRSTSRHAATDGMARDEVPEYLRALASALDVDVQELTMPMKDYRCTECEVVYVDPSLSDRALNRLYLTSAPIHNAGWASFTKRVLGDPDGTSEVELLEKFVLETMGVPESYLEVGCPFSGLALLWADPNALREAAASGVGDSRYSTANYRRFMRSVLTSYRLGAWVSDLIVRGWLGAVRVRRRIVGGDVPSTAIRSSTKLSHLAEFSVNRWSTGCRAFGRSCTEIASSGMGMEILSRERLRDLPPDIFELAGIINSLDHSDRPLDLLLEVVRVSRSTIVAGHRTVDAHLQHRFALSDNTLPRLAANAGLVFKDVSSAIGGHSKDWFVFILAKPGLPSRAV